MLDADKVPRKCKLKVLLPALYIMWLWSSCDALIETNVITAADAWWPALCAGHLQVQRTSSGQEGLVEKCRKRVRCMDSSCLAPHRVGLRGTQWFNNFPQIDAPFVLDASAFKIGSSCARPSRV